MVGRALTDNAGRRFIKFVSSFRLIVSYLLSSSVQPWPLIWRCALDQTNRGGGCLDTLFNVNCRTLFLFQKTQKKSNPGRPGEIFFGHPQRRKHSYFFRPNVLCDVLCMHKSFLLNSKGVGVYLFAVFALFWRGLSFFLNSFCGFCGFS